MKKIVLKLLFSHLSILLHAQTIYVATNGHDNNVGAADKPIASFKKAQELARKIKDKTAVKVVFKSGVYYLPETIQFTKEDNNKKGVTYEAEQEGAVTISGGKKLDLVWKPFKDNIFVADVHETLAIDQLFVNGKRQRMARYPNAQEGKVVFDAWELSHNAKPDSLKDALLPSRIHTWRNPAGAYVHAMHNYLWGDMHWLIKGKKDDGQLIMEGGWQNNRPSKMHAVYKMVENVFEELDAPSEWFYNAEQRKLYYFPDSGIDVNKAVVEVVRLKHLIEFNGSPSNPVQNIHLNGFTFKHAARTFMDNKEPLQRSDWTVYRGGAIVFNGSENCTISNSEFDHVGGNTIFVNHYNRHITIKGCYIHHSGASGILFVGDSAAVRSPLYGYVKRNYGVMDTVKGPRSNNYPADCLVEDCLITLTGRDEKQTAGVHISVAANIRVNHCSIYDMPRAGININEGTFGGHIIENSDIFNTVLETGDHGSFNSWGRDRFWTGEGKEVANAIEKSPNLYLLDMLAPNIIRHNRWRCDFGWDIDLDDGSSHYRIYNNVLLSRGLKLREGYDRVVTNNIILNNSLHPHVWFPNSGDVFKHNIVFSAYKPAIMNKVIPDNGQWGAALDSNLFVCDTAQMHRFLKNGCDIHSINGNPLFENVEKGDYRVQSNSPALKIGFKNFPIKGFGVQKTSLKVIAKQPQLPEININLSVKSIANTKSLKWMKAVIQEPKGDEFSAYGIGFNEGGIALTAIEEHSELAKAGFKSGDIIQVINGISIKNLKDFQSALDKIVGTTENYVFELIRNQKHIQLVFVGKLEKM